jgi:hypothetical protein
MPTSSVSPLPAYPLLFYNLAVINYVLARTILYGIERYIRNITKDLRDIYDIAKNNKTKLDRLDKKQNEYFKQTSIWQKRTTISLKRLYENKETTYQEVKRIRKEQKITSIKLFLTGLPRSITFPSIIISFLDNN